MSRFRLFVVGEGVCPVVVDVVVGGGVGFVEVVAWYWSLGELGQDALAGATGVELVRWKFAIDFEWFEHNVSPRFGVLNGQGLLVALVATCSP
jgi:hypothetical protein